MKRTILSLIIVISIVIPMSAVTLREAFTSLSKLPAISERGDTVGLPVVAETIRDAQIAYAYHLDESQILESGNSALGILNHIPLFTMINGANNNDVAAFIYSTPSTMQMNEILIAAMSGRLGALVFVYGTIDTATRNAIHNAPLYMQGDNLSIRAVMPDGTDFNILLGR